MAPQPGGQQAAPGAPHTSPGCCRAGGCEAEGLAASLTLKELALHHLEFSALLIFVRLLICVFFPPHFKGAASWVPGTSWDPNGRAWPCCFAGSHPFLAKNGRFCPFLQQPLPFHGSCVTLPSLAGICTAPGPSCWVAPQLLQRPHTQNLLGRLRSPESANKSAQLRLCPLVFAFD